MVTLASSEPMKGRPRVSIFRKWACPARWTARSRLIREMPSPGSLPFRLRQAVGRGAGFPLFLGCSRLRGCQEESQRHPAAKDTHEVAFT